MPLITMAREGVDKYLVVNTDTKKAHWVKSALVWELDKEQESSSDQQWSVTDSYNFLSSVLGKDLGAVVVEAIPPHPDQGYSLVSDDRMIISPDKSLRVPENLRANKVALSDLLASMSHGGVALVDSTNRAIVRFISRLRYGGSERRTTDPKPPAHQSTGTSQKTGYEADGKRGGRWRESSEAKGKQSTLPVQSLQKTLPESRPPQSGQEPVLDRFFNDLMSTGTIQIIDEIKKVQSRLAAIEAIEARLSRIERSATSVESSVFKLATQQPTLNIDAPLSTQEYQAELEKEKRTVQSLQLALQNERARVESAQTQALETVRKQLTESLLDLRGMHDPSIINVMDLAKAALKRSLQGEADSLEQRILAAFEQEFKSTVEEISVVFGQIGLVRSRLIELGLLKPRG